MQHRLSILLLVFSFVVVFNATAQEEVCDNPAQTLSLAESEFSAGHFSAIPGILRACLDKNGFSVEETVRAYLVLAQAYMILDDPTAAEDSYLKLLKADPEFVPNDTEHPIDIVYLSKKFTSTPIFTPHGRVGFSATFVNTIHTVGTDPISIQSSNSSGFGFQVGGGIDYNLNDNVSIGLELNVASKSYKRTRPMAGSDLQSVTANQWWFDFPLYVKYSDNFGKIRPFGYAGVALNYLLSAKNDFIYTDTKSGGSQIVAEGPSESVTYQRNPFNRSWIIGGGVKYKISKDFIYVDLRYMGGMSNLTDVDNIYYEDPLTARPVLGDPSATMSNNVTRYRYAADLFRIDNLSFSFGYVHPLYAPRKLKKARTKGVAKQIKKEGGKTK